MIKHLLQLHPWGQGATELLENGVNSLCSFDGIAARQLDHTKTDAWMPSDAIDARLIEILEGILSTPYIPQTDQAAIRAFSRGLASWAAGEHKILKLLHRFKIAIHQEWEGGVRSLWCRRPTNTATHHNLVLRLQRIHHINDGEIEASEFFRIHPQPIGRIAGSIHRDLPNPLSPRQGVSQIQLIQAIEIAGTKLAIRGCEVVNQQRRTGGLLHGDALGIHLLGQL